ncbi:MAG: hypothetical protein GXY36_03495 [Chloroflexi bacterium]|nr:hypothetical protein [Chloroflexota bacterium]
MSGWKTRTYVIGGVIGLAVGILAAYFYARAAEENPELRPARIKTMDAMKLAVALLAIVRQVTDLGTQRD